jgi:HAD-superfamily hydrolase, subfamily IIB
VKKTLYVSDLDGTLLHSDQTISPFTVKIINDLISQGMLFSYATARSLKTSRKVTQGFHAQMPLIVYNGAIVVDSLTNEIILSYFFNKNEIEELIKDLCHHHVYPLVYQFLNGVEKFSYIERYNSQGVQAFLDTRKNDDRQHIVDVISDLYKGDCFYVTCIDEKNKLDALYEKYKHKFRCIYQEDMYLHNQWLEIMPKNVSKAHAVTELKKRLKCDRLIVFGDGINDIDMFQVADEAYAVENAQVELKEIADGIIGNHNDDAVAKYLLETFTVK